MQELCYKWGHQIPAGIPTEYIDTDNINNFEATTPQLKSHLFTEHHYTLDLIVTNR